MTSPHRYPPKELTPSVFDAKAFLSDAPKTFGVYQMFDRHGKILYVGKAKNLKNRLSSYFRSTGLTPKTEALVSRIAHIETTQTPTETDALVLEHNLIKSQKPPYNILLRDDKSYPYILVTTQEDFPRIAWHRGAQKIPGRYFGPYPNGRAARESLTLLQKIFRLRPCEDSVFRNRSRPCLQHQIDRCKAPCVDAVSKAEYDQDVEQAMLFLQGKSDEVQEQLAKKMEVHANNLAFEQAAQCRDQIADLRALQADSSINGGHGNLDVMSIAQEGDGICVHVLFVRQGSILGSRSYFPEERLGSSGPELLRSFALQFYWNHNERNWPSEVITALELPDAKIVSDAIFRHSQRRVAFKSQVRAQRAKWLQMATEAAHSNLQAKLSQSGRVHHQYQALAEAIRYSGRIQHMECFDISHSSGESTVASCVVFKEKGPDTSEYRRFNIKGITAGDDYAAMQQALTRRYKRLMEENRPLPDLLIVDGGKGQLSQAMSILDELGLPIRCLGIAKGTTRKAGFETLIHPASTAPTTPEHHSPSNHSSSNHSPSNQNSSLQNASAFHEQVLDGHSPALHLLQAIRDEAHRFAITGHRKKRDKARNESSLESVAGVGNKRRQALLRHFGGIQGVKRASSEELAQVNGVSKALAERIFEALHVNTMGSGKRTDSESM